MEVRSSPGDHSLKVLLIENDPHVAQLLAIWFADRGSRRTLAIAPTLRQALTSLNSGRPHLVLLEASMPDGNGLEYLPELRKASVKSRIVAWTARDDAAFVERALRSQLDGIVHKHDVATPARFFDVLKHLVVHERFISPRIAKAADSLQGSRSFTKMLSDRELTLLGCFGRNLSDFEIGSRMGLSSHTVHTHRQRVMAKLDLHTSAALVAWCVEHGYTDRRSFRPELPRTERNRTVRDNVRAFQAN